MLTVDADGIFFILAQDALCDRQREKSTDRWR
jgi:hypothetical protein